jgi:hypothetical protein
MVFMTQLTAVLHAMKIKVMTTFLLLLISCEVFYVRCPLCWEDGSSFTNASGPCLGPCRDSRDSRPYFTVSDSRLSQSGAPGWHLFHPGTGWPSYTPRHWVPFSFLFMTCKAISELFDPPPQGVPSSLHASQSHVDTDCQSVGVSSCQAPILFDSYIFVFVGCNLWREGESFIYQLQCTEVNQLFEST